MKNFSLYTGFLLLTILSGHAQAQAGSSLPVVFESPDAFYSSFNGSLPEYGAGIGGQLPAMLPEGVLKLPANERFIFWAELEQGRLNILEQQRDGGLIIRKIIPMSIGVRGYGKEYEGDQRTPVGVYHFTSFLAAEQLIDFYGPGAYPMNYPNALDRLQQRTGSGIWLHGLPSNTPQRPLLDSDGCVVIDNPTLLQMAAYINTGRTPIILTEEDIRWRPMAEVEAERRDLEQAFENWRRAWESRDNDHYLSFYAEDFSDLRQDLVEWSTYKRRINNAKSYIRVNVSDISFYADPREPEIVSVRYYQTYRSSNYNWDGWKELLWRNNGSGWEIIYEG